MCLKLINTSIQLVCESLNANSIILHSMIRQPTEPNNQIYRTKIRVVSISRAAEKWKKMECIFWCWHVFIKVYYCWESFGIFSVEIFIQRTYDNEIWYVCLNRRQQQQQNSCQVYGKLGWWNCCCVIPGKCYASQEVHEKFGLFK